MVSVRPSRLGTVPRLLRRVVSVVVLSCFWLVVVPTVRMVSIVSR